jgi:NAD(P)H-hydrate repair Nnr-like enzyme with NAD(P)H-hydrate dehydratase domain
LATSGSGDVLAGIIAGLIARGAAPVQAAVWGVAVHAEAGLRLGRRIGRVGFLARELLDEIAPALHDLETDG